MKKILVPIDFSICANNAVHYAIQLARVIKADVHICHALAPLESNLMLGVVVSTELDYEAFEAKTAAYLETYIKKLIEEENLNIHNSPTLTYSFSGGTVKGVINHHIEHDKIDLIVMGLSGASEVERFLMGSNSRDQIEGAKIPTLLIPKNASFNNIKKIAFATDLQVSDMNSIQHLARLFCNFNPEILLSHIDGLPSDFHHPDSPANLFLKNVTGKINYSKIYYRHVQQKNINDGLMWLTQKGHIEIMAMVHRHKGMFAELIHGSHTQQMAKRVTLPLLVMPEENETVS